MFQSPQWGDNSKAGSTSNVVNIYIRFSPRNGEIILKVTNNSSHKTLVQFQSPQWGDNSKAPISYSESRLEIRFSPRNGEIILKLS